MLVLTTRWLYCSSSFSGFFTTHSSIKLKTQAWFLLLSLWAVVRCHWTSSLCGLTNLHFQDKKKMSFWIWLGYPEIDVCCQILHSTLVRDICNMKYRFGRPPLLLHFISVINTHRGKTSHTLLNQTPCAHGNTLPLCKNLSTESFLHYIVIFLLTGTL